MEKYAWVEEFSGSVIVCDPDGIILEMNEKAVSVFQKGAANNSWVLIYWTATRNPPD
jgi:hypothetical protein